MAPKRKLTLAERGLAAFAVYWDRETWELSRSAYMADLDDLPKCPDSWIGWFQRALERHVRRSARARAALEVPVPERNPSGSQGALKDAGEPLDGFTKTHVVPADLKAKIEQAITDDRAKMGRMVSRSQFAREAAAAAIGETRARRGGRRLPLAPDPLPNKPPKRARA
ncbi:hypothetical protein ATK17_3790 [Branchiibius hedensis]|uniref:Uncharacterized protein n=1 Tax=Branchiibius hedensis TaxID=672460 RepID=A0A2Y9C6X0_9MICO|nr:hypothetical protein [Branchiibius hedensis]PWJ23296.1 hypothetical protein ATK17_3790 [Branchiibius hedensis]SSA58985.1 hypothetical protein SAMN04489750_3790 [Branchiibius hedensis]